MDRPLIDSLCGWSLSSATVLIGTLQSLIFTGMFLWDYAYTAAQMIEFDVPMKYVMEELTLQQMSTGAALVCCVFNYLLIIGVRKSRPGFILTWLLNQLVWIGSSLVTIFYYLVTVWLKLPLEEAMIQLAIIGVQMFCLLVVYSHYLKMRSGNLDEEP